MKNLKEVRLKRNITMKQLGREIGLAESTISLYESGKRQPDATTLCKLADFFDCSVDYLLGRTDIPYGYIQKMPPELEDVGVTEVTKTKNEPLTPQEIDALRRFLATRKD